MIKGLIHNLFFRLPRRSELNMRYQPIIENRAFYVNRIVFLKKYLDISRVLDDNPFFKRINDKLDICLMVLANINESNFRSLKYSVDYFYESSVKLGIEETKKDFSIKKDYLGLKLKNMILEDMEKYVTSLSNAIDNFYSAIAVECLGYDINSSILSDKAKVCKQLKQNNFGYVEKALNEYLFENKSFKVWKDIRVFFIHSIPTLKISLNMNCPEKMSYVGMEIIFPTKMTNGMEINRFLGIFIWDFFVVYSRMICLLVSKDVLPRHKLINFPEKKDDPNHIVLNYAA